jgi:hypothetical protein
MSIGYWTGEAGGLHIQFVNEKLLHIFWKATFTKEKLFP